MSEGQSLYDQIIRRSQEEEIPFDSILSTFIDAMDTEESLFYQKEMEKPLFRKKAEAAVASAVMLFASASAMSDDDFRNIKKRLLFENRAAFDFGDRLIIFFAENGFDLLPSEDSRRRVEEFGRLFQLLKGKPKILAAAEKNDATKE